MNKTRLIKIATCILGYVLLITILSYFTQDFKFIKYIMPATVAIVYFSFCIVIDAVVAMYLEERRNRELKDLINKNYNKEDEV